MLSGGLAAAGSILVAPHRKARKWLPTADGRRLRRYRRRYIVERTTAWQHSFWRVVSRFERHMHIYDGFVYLACVVIAPGVV